MAWYKKQLAEYGVTIKLNTPVDEESIKESIKIIKDKFSHIDILVNNAGINKLAPAEEMSLDVWQKIIDVNLTGTFLMCREVGDIMLKQGRGNIVNIASIYLRRLN